MSDKPSIANRNGLFGIALMVPLLLLLSIGIFSDRSAKIVHETNDAMRRAVAVKAVAGKLLNAMIDNETGQRGFILTQNPKFLEPYERSFAEISRNQEMLALYITEAKARAEFAALKSAIEARLRFAVTSVDLQKAGKHDESVALEISGEGKHLMDEVRAAEAILDSYFDKLAMAREDEYSRVVMQNERLSWVVVMLDCIFGGVFILLLFRLRRHEQLLIMCAWSKTVKYKGEWVTFEEYLVRRFGLNITHGISPAEAEKLMANLREAHSD